MRVLFLQRQPCIRALKYAYGLRAALPDLHLAFAYQGLTLDALYGEGDDAFDEWIPLGEDHEPARQILRAIEHVRPDVIHSHNLPDLLTVLALEASEGRVPVIHDVHDMQALRRTQYRDGFPQPDDPAGLERMAVEGCAAIVTVSDQIVEAIDARYRRTGPAMVYANYLLARDLPRVPPAADRPSGTPLRVVYEGSLGIDGGHYDLREIFLQIVDAGLHLDVHPARPAPRYAELARPGLVVHDPLPAKRMMERLPGYDIGWTGFNTGLNAAHLDTALPNKLFEYLGCGLPVATLDHAALRRFVTGHGVGVTAPDVPEVARLLAQADMAGMRRSVDALRGEISVEANVGRLVSLYHQVIGRTAPLAVAVPAGD